MHLAGGVRIGQDGRTMYFPAVQTAYSGNYKCQASVTDEEGDQTVEAHFFLEVHSYLGLYPT